MSLPSQEQQHIMHLLEDAMHLLEHATGAKSIMIIVGSEQFPCLNHTGHGNHKLNIVAGGMKNVEHMKGYLRQAYYSLKAPGDAPKGSIPSPFSPVPDDIL